MKKKTVIIKQIFYEIIHMKIHFVKFNSISTLQKEVFFYNAKPYPIERKQIECFRNYTNTVKPKSFFV